MRLCLALLCGLFLRCTAWASPASETVEQALCRLIETSAQAHQIPNEFLTKLIWQESSFRPHVTSSAGAQGVAQFMPGTARERGLEDPFDPEQAIPKAAELILELSRRFGNLGLAAAAYNGGPARVAAWLAGEGGLPAETRNYVFAITGRSVDAWAADLKSEEMPQAKGEADPPEQNCLQVVAALRQTDGGMLAAEEEAPFAPWGVQLAGNFSKNRALASFSRARKSYAAVLGDVKPMIIGTRLRSRGTRTFYRVRVPAASRQEANELCNQIRRAGGACIVLPS